jgi:hypothetical protein
MVEEIAKMRYLPGHLPLGWWRYIIETENDLRFAESPDHCDQLYQPAIIKDCRLIRLFAMIGLKIKKSLSKQSAVSCVSILYRT